MKSEKRIYSPVDGEIIPMNKVNDEVFRKQYFGRGITIKPKSDKIVSPVAGVIDTIAEDGHSIMIKADNNVMIWVYIGVDVVQLNGKYIDKYVKKDESVDVGTHLLNCDFYEMINCNYDVEVSVTVMNQENVFEVIPLKEGSIKKKEELVGILFHPNREEIYECVSE
jgi:glucose-specific phosphotransferase system IIA component